MAGNLHVDAKAKEPVSIKENTNDQDTQRLEEVEGIPKDITVGIV
jgi:hypothetical protein